MALAFPLSLCVRLDVSVGVLSQMMEQLTDHHYEVLTVPEESAANCIYIKGPSKRDFLLHRPAEESPDSVSVSTTQEVELKPANTAIFMRLLLSSTCKRKNKHCGIATGA